MFSVISSLVNMVKRKPARGSTSKNAALQRAMKKLTRMDGKKRRYALQHANNLFIQQLSSAVKAVRRKPLSSKVRGKLVRHRAALRSLANPHTSLLSKRRVVVRQKGGFFGAILASLAAPLIGTLVKSVANTLGR